MSGRGGTSPAEWAVAAAGAAALVAMLGYLGWAGLTGSDAPPALSVEAEAPRPAGAGWLVPFVARNDGASAAAAVTVRGSLGPAEAPLEESAAELDYVPTGSRRRGGLMFTQDPRGHPLALRVEGYAEP